MMNNVSGESQWTAFPSDLQAGMERHFAQSMVATLDKEYPEIEHWYILNVLNANHRESLKRDSLCRENKNTDVKIASIISLVIPSVDRQKMKPATTPKDAGVID